MQWFRDEQDVRILDLVLITSCGPFSKVCREMDGQRIICGVGPFQHSWAHNIKNVAPQKQNAIALFNYLKSIVPQQLMLRMQVFTKKILSGKNATATLIFRQSLQGHCHHIRMALK